MASEGTTEINSIEDLKDLDADPMARSGENYGQAPKRSIESVAEGDRRNANHSSGSEAEGILEAAAISVRSQRPVSNPDSSSTQSDLTINLGTLRDSEAIEVITTPEHLFGRHCGVFGTTGGGKSWTLARILEECVKFRSKIILFDASGEFFPLSHGVRHIHVGLDPDPPQNSKEVSVPYFHLRESDLVSIFQPQGPSQAPKLRSAIKTLKLARLAPQLAPDGTIIKAHRPKMDFDEQQAYFAKEMETPYAVFDINHLTRQVQNECVDPFRSAVEPNVWGGPNTVELSNCSSLVNKITDVISMPQLSCIFDPGEAPSIFNEIHTFLKDPVSRVLRISLKYLPFDYHAREIVANALARHLLELAREDFFRRLPLVVVLDEAHQFLNQNFSAELKEGSALDSFGLIAKEGRKYALTICLSTQRPRDIPEDVLSQLGTMMVHRLINHFDLTVVERAGGNLDQHLMKQVPKLKSGQSLLVGVDFPEPLFIQVQAPDCPPHSRSADYQKLWK